MLLLVMGLSAAGASAYLGYIEIQAIRKKQQIYQYVYYLTSDMKTNEAIRDACLIGAGSTALSIFSIYNEIENHEQVLNIMEYRYPNELLEMTPLEWLNKVERLYQDGDQALNGFISGYAGQAAENITVEQFEAMGATATLFESRTHANDDIAVTMDGETLFYSVKSYSDSTKFEEAVANHPESTHYVVNQELYNQLQEKGLLDHYEEQGITIVEGNYSNVALREEASQAFLDIHEAADAADYIPFISAPLFMLRSGFNIKAYREGKQSGHELSVNVIGDAGKIGVATGFGFGGAKLGGIIGTAIFPGLGTVIGGGIGAVIGGLTGSKLMQSVKSYFKWGKIIEVQEKVGKTFLRIGKEKYKQYYLQHMFPFQQIEMKLVNSKQLANRYEEELNLYNSKKASLPAVLQHMYVEHTNHIREGIEKTAEQLPEKIEHFAQSCANKLKRPEVKYAFIGELMLQQNSRLWLPEDMQAMKQDITMYELERKKNPNYPYQFQMAADHLLQQITEETLDENIEPNKMYTFLLQDTHKYRKAIIILAIVSVLTLLIFFNR